MKKFSILLQILLSLLASVPCAAKWLNPADVVCGRWWGDELKGTYHRMPDRAQHDVRSAVWNLSKQSAGLSIKFHSNAPSIRVRYQVTDKLNMFHMPTTGVSGLDLYATDADGLLRWCASRFNLSFKDTINYEFRHITYFTGDRRGYDYEQRRAYDTLVARGVTRLYYLSHDELAFTQESMIEGIHPNDIGMRQYADAYIRKIYEILEPQVSNLKSQISYFRPRTQQRDPYNWHERHEQILRANCLEAPQIIMIGNSITHYWTDRSGADAKDYRSSWDKLFRGRVARNLGFGFDRIENGLWRVIHGELDGFSADKIFLLLGTNNLSTNTDEEIVQGMLLLIRAVRQRQPNARIYQCGILPRRGELQRVNHINALLQQQLKGIESSFRHQTSSSSTSALGLSMKKAPSSRPSSPTASTPTPAATKSLPATSKNT